MLFLDSEIRSGNNREGGSKSTITLAVDQLRLCKIADACYRHAKAAGSGVCHAKQVNVAVPTTAFAPSWRATQMSQVTVRPPSSSATLIISPPDITVSPGIIGPIIFTSKEPDSSQARPKLFFKEALI